MCMPERTVSYTSVYQYSNKREGGRSELVICVIYLYEMFWAGCLEHRQEVCIKWHIVVRDIRKGSSVIMRSSNSYTSWHVVSRFSIAITCIAVMLVIKRYE